MPSTQPNFQPVVTHLLACLLISALPFCSLAAETVLPTIDVSADQQRSLAWQAIGNVSRLTQQQINRTAAHHPAELLNAVPGTWISRGNGQEHLTAIRSPVLTGPGACGAFLLLENGLPIRPAGFCNVNNLFELNHEQAAEIEVIRGPASALYGGNALHGVINLHTPAPAGNSQSLRLDSGANDFGRLSYSASRATELGNSRIDYNASHDNGWRDHAGYEQQKLGLQHQQQLGQWQLNGRLSGSWLQQETAGFILGEESYKQASLRRDNLNPEAYRNAWSGRGSVELIRGFGDDGWFSVTPYWRRSKMEFLQHFLPEQSLEQNGQHSVGVMTSAGNDFGNGHRWSWTLQLEYADIYLKEVQQNPLNSPSAFLVATRPVGTHYDYQVDSYLAASHLNLEWQLADNLQLVTSARVESLRYRYDNRFLDGNSKADGTPCGFGGCKFTRPADRKDHFSNLGGRIGLHYSDGQNGEWTISGGYGFRPPQATELYRLQSGQLVTDLESETIRSLELSHSRQLGPVNAEITLFAMSKQHVILRDATGANISNGKTRHHGLELDVLWQINTHQTLQLSATQALHRYGFDSALPGGETITDGNQVDTAPNHLASLNWRYQNPTGGWLALQGQYMGSYAVDAANDHHYDGHQLLNLRAGQKLAGGISIQAAITNLTDSKFAERADFAFGNFRYFPGAARQLRLSVKMDW